MKKNVFLRDIIIILFINFIIIINNNNNYRLTIIIAINVCGSKVLS